MKLALLACVLLNAAVAAQAGTTLSALEARRARADSAAASYDEVYHTTQGYTVARTLGGGLSLVPSSRAAGAAPAAPAAAVLRRSALPRRLPPQLPQLPQAPAAAAPAAVPAAPLPKAEELPAAPERDEEYEDEAGAAVNLRAAEPAGEPAPAGESLYTPATAAAADPTLCIPGRSGGILVDAATNCPEGFSPESGGLCSKTILGCKPTANEIDGQCCERRKARFGAPVCKPTMLKTCPSGMFSSGTICSNSPEYKEVLDQVSLAQQSGGKEAAGGTAGYTISLAAYDLSRSRALDGDAETQPVPKEAMGTVTYTGRGVLVINKAALAPECFYKCCATNDPNLCSPKKERKLYVEGSSSGCPAGCSPADGGKCKCGDVAGTGRCPSGMKACWTTAGRVCATSVTVGGVDACTAVDKLVQEMKPNPCPAAGASAGLRPPAASAARIQSEAGPQRRRVVDRLAVAEGLAAGPL